METAIVNGALLVSKGLLSSAIYDIYGLIKKSASNSYCYKLIEQLDIEADIEVVEALIEDVEQNGKTKIHSIQTCMKHIQTLLEKIKIELENIHLKTIDGHYQNYYSYWSSSPNYNENVTNLKTHKAQLNKRLDTFVKILSINM